MPAIIDQIQALLSLRAFVPAPVRAHDPLGGLMAQKQDTTKYQYEGDRLIGLNLANTGLTDEQWASILALPNFVPGDLQALNLSDNQLKEFQLPEDMRNLVRLNVADNVLSFPPPEITSRGNEAILRFLKDLQSQGEKEVYEVKMLIVGEGETGKTTLWNKLRDPDYPVPQTRELQPSTVGIQIHEGWKLPHPDKPDTNFLLHMWDFGGQEIQYMTHQFFLTRRSLYVLLADGRRETANFAYWFKIIDLLGVDPEQETPLPVLVVLNEKGNPIARAPYDPQTVKADYPRLNVLRREVDFAIQDDRLPGLTQAILSILGNEACMPHLPLRIPTYWDQVREALNQIEDRKYLNLEQYQEICRDNQIEDEQQMADLSQMLHDLGLILHYQDDDNLADFIVLDPQWAVNAVYEVLRHKEVLQNQGRFDRRFLSKVLAEKGYKVQERGKLTNLMLKDSFEVCFRAEEGKREIFIAPQLLPEVREAFDWEDSPYALRYIYQYPFMPKGLMGRLIVRLNAKIEARQQRKIVWQMGMVLRQAGDDCRALVQEKEDRDTGGKIIEINVLGSVPENRRHLLREIRSELETIHQRSFPRLRYVEKVPCCCSKCHAADTPYFFELTDLHRAQSEGHREFFCADAFTMVPIKALLEGVFAEEFREQASDSGLPAAASAPTAPPTVFLSYSRKDKAHLDALKTALGVMRRKKELLLWDDGHLLPGEEWDATIKTALGQAEIILLLLSDHALDTDYIWDIEMQEALRRHEKGEATVIPIILEPCDWEETDFSKLLALPAKAVPVSQWEQGEKAAWQAVVQGIRRVLQERTKP